MNKKLFNQSTSKQFDFSNLKLEPIEYMSDQELISKPVGSTFFFDVECYQNIFYIAFLCADTGKVVSFEQSEERALETSKLNWLLWRFCIVSFNGINYDIPVISYAKTGKPNEAIKQVSDDIIQNNLKAFQFEDFYKIKIEKYNHIDLINVAPLQGSLKLYGGRLHCPQMQDLPFEPEHVLDSAEMAVLRLYCGNDLRNTELLYNELEHEVKLRNTMSQKYAFDMRSKSDAQIAETTIGLELKRIFGHWPKKPNKKYESVTYNVPEFIQFETPVLQNVLDTVGNTVFAIDGIGRPVLPKSIEQLNIRVGNAAYKFQLGGLHSMEKRITHVADKNIIISDNDVESFYPRVLLNQRLYPEHLGKSFLQIYENIVRQRLEAKHRAKEIEKEIKNTETKIKELENEKT